MKKSLLPLLILILIVTSCRGRKESIYIWKGPDETRKLTLLKNNTFILEINAEYFNRTDTGIYVIKSDTLLINPDKAGNQIDSLVEMDTLFNGQRFFEVMEQEISYGMDNDIVESFYRPRIFPSVIVNDTVTLAVSPDDPSFRKLVIPDSLLLYNARIIVQEDNTCKPVLSFRLELPVRNPPSQSYRVFVRSRASRENYLAGFKWLMRGDTIESFFKDDGCEPTEIKLVRAKL